jgi:hypothetical protein
MPLPLGLVRCAAIGVPGRRPGSSELLEGDALPHGLVGHEGTFSRLTLDRNDPRFEQALIDRGTGAPKRMGRRALRTATHTLGPAGDGHVGHRGAVW